MGQGEITSTLREVFCETSKEIETHLDNPNYHEQSKIKFVFYSCSQIADVLETNCNLIQLTLNNREKKNQPLIKLWYSQDWNLNTCITLQSQKLNVNYSSFHKHSSHYMYSLCLEQNEVGTSHHVSSYITTKLLQCNNSKQNTKT